MRTGLVFQGWHLLLLLLLSVVVVVVVIVVALRDSLDEVWQDWCVIYNSATCSKLS